MDTTTTRAERLTENSTSTIFRNRSHVTTSENSSCRDCQFHPGYTTLIGCVVLFLMLMAYMCSEPTRAYFRRRRIKFIHQRSTHSSSVRDGLEMTLATSENGVNEEVVTQISTVNSLNQNNFDLSRRHTILTQKYENEKANEECQKRDVNNAKLAETSTNRIMVPKETLDNATE